MAWILRGLRDGIVTTRYPRRPDGYGPGFRGAITVVAPRSGWTDDRDQRRRRAMTATRALCPDRGHRDRCIESGASGQAPAQ